ncbi:MAG: hypothetical protein A2074_04515 [Candidatus Aquicultor primus]|uniref:Uncharacterized protein n=1 Tax=Candidatus Aquicultor primus TaxID=1797195 RepID=A0A1F2UGF5_9ACTN|nr:MAG: hypothetical protein A2074_04515 [Candidatus Aquicultor primus]
MRKLCSALLICLILPGLLIGCQKDPDERDPFKAANSNPVRTSQQAGAPDESGASVRAADSEALDQDVLQLQEELETFNKDIADLENFGVESAVSEIDRELDGF